VSYKKKLGNKLKVDNKTANEAKIVVEIGIKII